jgi:aryl-alcohol dehydrogenase-like predicted oxidoreductase
MEVIPAAREFGIGLFPYMPLAGGLLTGTRKPESGSRTEQVAREYGLDLGSQQFSDYIALCEEIGEPPFVVAIAWVLANPAVSSAIVGARTVKHLNGLDRAAELELSPEHMARLNEIFDINKGRPLRGSEAPFAFAW